MRWTCITLLAFFLSCMAFGQEGPSHIYFGPEVFWFKFNHHLHDVKLDDKKPFWGMHLRYEYLKPRAFYWGVDVAGARSHRHAPLRTTADCLPSNAQVSLSNLELRAGYTFGLQEGTSSLFLGSGGYGFASPRIAASLLYYAAGLRSVFLVRADYTLGFNFKLLRTDDQKEKAYLSASHPQIHLKRFRTLGGAVSLPITGFLDPEKKWVLQLEPYYLKLNIASAENAYGANIFLGCSF